MSCAEFRNPEKGDVAQGLGGIRKARYLSNGLGSAAFFLIAVTNLAGGCDHPGSKSSGSDTTAPVAVSQLSPSLVGKRITVRGKLFMFNGGQCIQLDNGDVVCLGDMPPKSAFGDPYAGVNDKPSLKVTITKVCDTPMKGQMPPEQHHKVAFANLKSGVMEFSATDWRHSTRTPRQGNTVALYICGEKYNELRTVFDKLAVGASKELLDDMRDMRFGSYGHLADKYGVHCFFQGDKSEA